MGRWTAIVIWLWEQLKNLPLKIDVSFSPPSKKAGEKNVFRSKRVNVTISTNVVSREAGIRVRKDSPVRRNSGKAAGKGTGTIARRKPKAPRNT